MFIQNLREATAASHKQLEKNYLSALLVSNNVTATVYTAYLLKIYPFIVGFEENVFPLLENTVTDIDQRKKAHLLKADIESFGVNIKDAAIIKTKFFSDKYGGMYEALGGMYVLEGSTLGGQIIQKHLQKILGPAFIGSKYFTAYNLQTGSYWKNFLQTLSLAPQNNLQEQQIISSAVNTFTFINDLLICNKKIAFNYENKEHC